ncbi:hypothetical protein GGX14DRAFT_398486 [Mycena pura]|uniref:Uncharacterized protein n=1 Tax=Mycena pura TaxID=153505 RepID=A0AAD6YBN0_9AGAR|nr:hypothetical protein GGX14DRAFT_398486 [Mycena pura]
MIALPMRGPTYQFSGLPSTNGVRDWRGSSPEPTGGRSGGAHNGGIRVWTVAGQQPCMASARVQSVVKHVGYARGARPGYCSRLLRWNVERQSPASTENAPSSGRLYSNRVSSVNLVLRPVLLDRPPPPIRVPQLAISRFCHRTRVLSQTITGIYCQHGLRGRRARLGVIRATPLLSAFLNDAGADAICQDRRLNFQHGPKAFPEEPV